MMLGRITILGATSVAAFAQDAREAEMVGPHQICNQGDRKMPGAELTRSGSGGNTDRCLTDISVERLALHAGFRRSKRRSNRFGSAPPARLSAGPSRGSGI